jgi:photosystem II stability/assembly factor-like uncharacterized protein
MSGGPVLLIGTRKGLFTLRSDTERTAWTLDEPQFLGHVIQHAVADPRSPQHIVVAARTGHLGPTVFRSDDAGATWREASQPPAFRTGDALGRSVDVVFWLTPGPADRRGSWLAGCSPQGLFASEDGGDVWASVAGWNDHPQWPTWCEWPEQNTPDGSMLHSVVVDPRDPGHWYLGLSSGGVFESVDGGRDWAPLNLGVAAAFRPEGLAEDQELLFGHDPHCVRMHPAMPDRLYQQNHCGIYRLDRPSDRWIRIGDNMPPDVGDIGFPIEVHPRDPDTAWVFPMDGTDVWPRTSPGGRPAVYVTRDAGASWTRGDAGLPERGWLTVKRQAMATDDRDAVGVYFGTTGGEVWGSTDEGATWRRLAGHLPEVLSLEVVSGPGPHGRDAS